MDFGKIFCIIIYCLDENLILFGEKLILKMLEGCICDIWEDNIMFGVCFDCYGVDYLNYGCCIGLFLNGYGFVGFFVKIIGFDKEVLGFFIVVYVVVENLGDLYFKKILLLEYDIGDFR